MSKQSANGSKTSVTVEAETPKECGCTDGLSCFEHYETDGGTVNVDVDLLPWSEHGELRKLPTRLPCSIDDGDDKDDERRRDWSKATVVRGPSGMGRIAFTA